MTDPLDMTIGQMVKIRGALDEIWGQGNLIEVEVRGPEDYLVVLEKLIAFAQEAKRKFGPSPREDLAQAIYTAWRFAFPTGSISSGSLRLTESSGVERQEKERYLKIADAVLREFERAHGWAEIVHRDEDVKQIAELESQLMTNASRMQFYAVPLDAGGSPVAGMTPRPVSMGVASGSEMKSE